MDRSGYRGRLIYGYFPCLKLTNRELLNLTCPVGVFSNIVVETDHIQGIKEQAVGSIWRSERPRAEIPPGTAEFRIPGALSHSFHNDGLVLLCLKSGKLYQINRTGAAIWRSIAQGGREEDLVERIYAELGISRADATAEVRRFTSSMATAGLLDKVAIGQ